jgi:hypothetical protein
MKELGCAGKLEPRPEFLGVLYSMPIVELATTIGIRYRPRALGRLRTLFSPQVPPQPDDLLQRPTCRVSDNESSGNVP